MHMRIITCCSRCVQVRRAGQITFVSMSSVLPQLRREAQGPLPEAASAAPNRPQQQQQPNRRAPAAGGAAVSPLQQLAAEHHEQALTMLGVSSAPARDAVPISKQRFYICVVCLPGWRQGAKRRTGEAAGSSARNEAGAPCHAILAALQC